jgi:hypothetical protein
MSDFESFHGDMRETCSVCKWWDKAGSPPPVHHRCMRYPPKVYSDTDGEIETHWPWTSPADRCGEWDPK